MSRSVAAVPTFCTMNGVCHPVGPPSMRVTFGRYTVIVVGAAFCDAATWVSAGDARSPVNASASVVTVSTARGTTPVIASRLSDISSLLVVEEVFAKGALHHARPRRRHRQGK